MILLKMLSFVIFTTFLLVTISAKSLPSNIEKCRQSDPELGKCLDRVVIQAVKKLSTGNKELGIVPLEPLFIEKVDLGTSGGAGIHQVYKNLELHNTVNASLQTSDVSFGDEDCHWNFKSFTPYVRMAADYLMDGKYLLFPINGHGKCEIKLYDIQSNYKIKCEKYTKKNKKHIKATHFEFTLKPKKVIYDFENIIGGNEQLSKELVKTLNENDLEVYNELGVAFNDVLMTVWGQTINEVFSRVPEEELFLH